MNRRLIEKLVYHNLPKELQILTSEFEGREKDIVLLSSLGVLSNCFPNIRGMYDSDTVYPNLYVIIIAPPASGKGVMKYSRILIEKIHEKIFTESKAEHLACEKRQKNKKDKEICPEIKVKILPANISSAEIYSFMASSAHGLLIIESEADTMSNMLKNDWSNYSDVLRKAFHHEPVSISRKMDKVFEDIKEPKLSMVISGTPDQLKPLMQSKDNGLYSRFIVYNFDEISEFKDVFAKKGKGKKDIFYNLADNIYEVYGILVKLEKPIEFEFTDKQSAKFLTRLKSIRNDIIEFHSHSFVPNLHRHGLMFFRIAMILTAIRNKETLHETEKLVCSNKDFLAAMFLMKTLLRHSQYTFNSLDEGFLTAQDEGILDNLNSSFNRQDAIKQGATVNVPIRTVDDKLVQWQKKRLIKKVTRGVFKKL